MDVQHRQHCTLLLGCKHSRSGTMSGGAGSRNSLQRSQQHKGAPCLHRSASRHIRCTGIAAKVRSTMQSRGPTKYSRGGGGL